MRVTLPIPMLFFFFFESFSSLSFIPSTQKIARKKHHAHIDCSCIPVLPDLVLCLYEVFSVCWYFEMEIMMLYPDFSVTAKKLHSAVNYRLSSTPPPKNICSYRVNGCAYICFYEFKNVIFMLHLLHPHLLNQHTSFVIYLLECK